jgi:hypothetical protein
MRGGGIHEWGLVKDLTLKDVHPMRTIPFALWIVDAGARFSTRHGAVSQQAKQSNCSRQTVYDHARKVLWAVISEFSGCPPRQQLLRQIQTLRQENAQLRNRLNSAIEFTQAKQQEFAAKARAMGLSLNQIAALLVVILGKKAARARSTIERWVQAAGKAAGRVLQQLDAQCKALVLLGCLDEIFFRNRPVLVGVEPASMTWFLGKKVGTLKGSIWAEQLQAWDALQYVVADAGVPLQAGIAQAQTQRGRDNKDPLASGLDVFHTKYEARNALTIAWNQVERDWEAYDQADAQVRKDQRRGTDSRSNALRATRAWAMVVKSFAGYETVEAAWKQAATALNVFRPDGRLNDRAWAQAQVAPTLSHLVGRAWVRVCNHLQAQETFTFLDRLHSKLSQILVSDELRDALVRLWWLRRQRPRKFVEGQVAGAGHVAHLVQQEICQKLDADWQEWYRLIAAILRGTVRASSAVECMNSVLRMHQSRHRTITPEMLDLKRLYWNCRAFLGGKRRGKCPYEHLGLKLPSFDFWDLLQPEFAEALNEVKAEAEAKTRAKAA